MEGFFINIIFFGWLISMVLLAIRRIWPPSPPMPGQRGVFASLSVSLIPLNGLYKREVRLRCRWPTPLREVWILIGTDLWVRLAWPPGRNLRLDWRRAFSSEMLFPGTYHDLIKFISFSWLSGNCFAPALKFSFPSLNGKIPWNFYVRKWGICCANQRIRFDIKEFCNSHFLWMIQEQKIWYFLGKPNFLIVWV